MRKIILRPFLAGILTLKTVLQSAPEHAIFIQKIEKILPTPSAPIRRLDPCAFGARPLLPLYKILGTPLAATLPYRDASGCSAAAIQFHCSRAECRRTVAAFVVALQATTHPHQLYTYTLHRITFPALIPGPDLAGERPGAYSPVDGPRPGGQINSV